MMTLAETLDAQAEAGQLTHCSVVPHHRRNGEPTIWRASYRDATSDGSFHGEGPTPSAAMVAALTARPNRKPRSDKGVPRNSNQEKPADDFDFG